MLVFIALDDHHAIEKVQGEIEPGKLFRPLTAERDWGLSVRRVARGDEKLEQSLLSLLPSLVGPLRVVPFDMLLQIIGLDVAGVTALYHADMGAVVLMDHFVILQSRRCLERFSTARGITVVRPLTRVRSLVVVEGGLLCE
jgi:hypothetical protein